MLILCASVEVSSDDGLPETLCARCFKELNIAYKFKKRCEQSDEYFRQYLTSKHGIEENSKTSPDNEKSDCEFSNEDTSNCSSKSEVNLELKTCNICMRSFKNSVILKRHSKSHEQLLDSGTNVKKLARSKKYVQQEDNGYNKIKSKNVCKLCNKVFTQASSLTVHMKRHNGEKEHQCHLCPKAFTTSGSLTIHVRSHTGERPYECKECRKCFVTSDGLLKHQRRHSGDRPHLCSVCGKGFGAASTLQVHMRVHSGDKPLQCKVCDMRFAAHAGLSVHLRKHTGERPYLCSHCGKGQRPYVCPQCGKGFNRPNNLAKHVRLHSGIKPYICEVCKYAFSTSSQLKVHMRSHTGSTGLRVSRISIGAGGFCPQYGTYTEQDCIETLHQAIISGINYIDTAPWYGQGESEDILGKALKGIPRQAYYIATKIGRYEKQPEKMFDFSAEKTRWSVDNSLRKLGLDYVDIIQVHDIEFATDLNQIINECLPTLEEVVKAGKARYIGVTGYPVSVLKECIQKSKTHLSTVLSYTRMTLIDDTLKEFMMYFQTQGLGVINAASPAMGLLTNGGPQPWHPASDETKDICREAAEYCKARNVELGRLAMNYAFSQPGPATHLVGMNTVPLLKSNFDVFFNGLTDHEKQVLEEINVKYFAKLKQRHWEGIEIEKYRAALHM
ncbi:uncharacterized protein CBL_05632 [Carabus blaptoides fortunei]